jgi:hypothetical protein
MIFMFNNLISNNFVNVEGSLYFSFGASLCLRELQYLYRLKSPVTSPLQTIEQV